MKTHALSRAVSGATQIFRESESAQYSCISRQSDDIFIRRVFRLRKSATKRTIILFCKRIDGDNAQMLVTICISYTCMRVYAIAGRSDTQIASVHRKKRKFFVRECEGRVHSLVSTDRHRRRKFRAVSSFGERRRVRSSPVKATTTRLHASSCDVWARVYIQGVCIPDLASHFLHMYFFISM